MLHWRPLTRSFRTAIWRGEEAENQGLVRLPLPSDKLDVSDVVIMLWVGCISQNIYRMAQIVQSMSEFRRLRNRIVRSYGWSARSMGTRRIIVQTSTKTKL